MYQPTVLPDPTSGRLLTPVAAALSALKSAVTVLKSMGGTGYCHSAREGSLDGTADDQIPGSVVPEDT